MHSCPIIDLDEDYGEYDIGAIKRGGESLQTEYASPQYITREEKAAILTNGVLFSHFHPNLTAPTHYHR